MAPQPVRLAAPRRDEGDVLRAVVLRAVVQRVQQLEARLQALEAERRTRHADPAADGRLLSAIANRFGSTVFSGRDLRRMVAIDADLRAALKELGARRLGAWLKRMHRHGGSAPYIVQRVGRDAAGALWRVSPMRHTETRQPLGDGA